MFPLNYKKLGLQLYPNKILRKMCKDVDLNVLNTEDIFKLCKFMKKISKKYDGIGLAAPQVGVDIRMIYVAPNSKEEFFLINPEIVEVSKEKTLESEGCLSLPNVFGTVIRPENITVQGYDEFGDKIEISADRLLARVIQHEIDHINGILFIDKLVTLTSSKEKLEALKNKAKDDER